MTAHFSRGWRTALGGVLLVWCSFFTQNSWALGLADIDVQSALNERFNATIELLDTQGFQPTEIVVKMASREDFDRVGVERFFFLTDLRFKVEPDANGNAQVVVTSAKPVSEPYLNFIVEVLWPSGRLLKEYTVLLDPPNFSQASAPLVDRPQAAPAQPSAPASTASSEASRGTQVQLSGTSGSSARASAPRRRDEVAADGTILTTVDDTLWKIANRTRENQVSVNQQMIALQRQNPRAFIRGNINLLKAGYRLSVPSVSEATALTASEADAEVAAHTQAWREGRSMVADRDSGLRDQAGADTSLASQVDATPVQIDTNTQTSSGEGQVRILANSGDSGSASGSGEVTQLIEEKAALDRQITELTEQLDQEKELAANQVTVKDRQLEVKDQEIAQLQSQLQEMRSEMSKIAENQNQGTRPAKAEPLPFWQTPMFLFGVIGVLILLLVGMLIALRRNRAEAQALEAYIDEQPIEEEYSDVEAAEDEPLTAGGYADEEPAVDQQIEPTLAADEADPSKHEILSLDDDDDSEEIASADDFAGETDEASGNEGTETSDVIGEAEIYIAYGRYGQAANLLLGVLNNEPDRHDVRLKLLETYVEANDDDSFATHAEYLLQNADDEDVLHACRELESQLQDNRVVLDDDSSDVQDDLSDDLDTSLEEDADDIPQEVETSADTLDDLDFESAEETLDLDLDADLETDFEAEVANLDESLGESLDAEGDTSIADDADEFTLEFDSSDLDATPGEEELEAESDDTTSGQAQDDDEAGHADVLGGDLGLDFDPDRDVADSSGEPDITEESSEALANEMDAELEAELDGDLDDLLEGLDETADAESDATTDTDALDLEFDTETGDSEGADGFDFGGADDDVNETKLDLAAAYIDMGDQDGARDILEEVVQEGSESQQAKARELLDQL